MTSDGVSTSKSAAVEFFTSPGGIAVLSCVGVLMFFVAALVIQHALATPVVASAIVTETSPINDRRDSDSSNQNKLRANLHRPHRV